MNVRSLLIKRAIFGRDAVNESLAGSLHNIGASYMASGNLEVATVGFEQALGMCRALHGNNRSSKKLQITSLS